MTSTLLYAMEEPRAPVSRRTACRSAPSVVVFIVILIVIAMYIHVITRILPMKTHTLSSIAMLCLITLTTSFTIISFFMTALTSPGNWTRRTDLYRELVRRATFIPNPFNTHISLSLSSITDEAWTSPLFPCVETKQSSSCRRYCGICRIYKPDRTHHCHTCNICHLRADHYCIFLNACIGYHNHKLFILFLFYSILSTGLMSLDILNIRIKNFQSIINDLTFFNFILLIIILILTLALSISICIFCFLHIYLMITNQTTIEFMELNNSYIYGKKYKNIYNINIYKNIEVVMGKKQSMFWWFIPVTAHHHHSWTYNNNNNNKINNNNNNFWNIFSTTSILSLSSSSTIDRRVEELIIPMEDWLYNNGIIYNINMLHPQRQWFINDETHYELLRRARILQDDNNNNYIINDNNKHHNNDKNNDNNNNNNNNTDNENSNNTTNYIHNVNESITLDSYTNEKIINTIRLRKNAANVLHNTAVTTT